MSRSNIAIGVTPNIVLIDGRDVLAQTISSIRESRIAFPNALIIVLDLVDHIDDILACIEAGSAAYTIRGADIETLIHEIEMICVGQATTSPVVTAQLFARLAALATPSTAVACLAVKLTEREHEILQLLAADCSNQEIAERLVIEVRTVKHHVHNILAKLQARHRWQAVLLAKSHGLLEKQLGGPEY
jgi:two-component system nitrate/nitrite response regulator NarL